MNRKSCAVRLPASALALALLSLPVFSLQAQTGSPRIPLVVGLTISTAVSSPVVGDYETLKTIDALAPDGAMG